MGKPPTTARPRLKASRFDRSWIRSIGFTVVLVGLVAAAIGADWPVAVVSVATCAIGFGFFYLVFPGGAHFGMTVANFLACYVCLFEFFREANFPASPRPLTLLSLGLPVLGFLTTCFVRRRMVRALIRMHRVRDVAHLPHLSRAFIGAFAVGAASFALPRLQLVPLDQGETLLAAMVLITVFICRSIRDVVLVMADVAIVFESVAARLNQLIMPMMAFLTFYTLLVVVFGCLYRIADLTTPVPQFSVNGHVARLTFVDALYYSVATITTLGFGDIAPASLLVRALTGAEVVSGVLMLLFGFSEIMRNAGPDNRPWPPEPPPDPR